MKKYIILGFLLLVHLFLLVNLQFTAWPEIFSFPYLKSNGYLLYRDMVHAYPPLLTLVLAIIYKLFGYQLTVLKIFTWIGILLNDIFIYLIIKKLTKSLFLASLFTCLYILVQPFLEGNMLWYDTALVTPVLLGTLFGLYVLQKPSIRNLIITGFFFAIASLIKQTGAFFLIGFVLIYLLNRKKLELVKYYFIAPVILWGVLFLRLITENALGGFFNWVLIYPSKYWTQYPGYVDLDLSSYEKRVFVLLVAPIIIFTPLIKRKINNKLIVLFSILSILAVYPRFSFFHFQTALAFIFILMAISAKEYAKKYHALAIIIVFGVLYLSRYQFMNRNMETRFFEDKQINLAKEIEKRVDKDNTIYLLGVNSHLYTFSGSLPPKPWSDNFGWHYQVPGFEEYVLVNWIKSPPEYIFWYISDSFQPKRITNWITNNYNRESEISENIEIWKIKN